MRQGLSERITSVNQSSINNSELKHVLNKVDLGFRSSVSVLSQKRLNKMTYIHLLDKF